MKKIRVLVVDDSALMRKMIPRILAADPGLEVAGTAMDGLFALKKLRELKPDVVTLDISMPRLDGIETLKLIRKESGAPVIMVSSLAREDAELTFQALELGAFDFVTKPQDAISLHIDSIGEELILKVKAAFDNPRPRLRTMPAKACPPPQKRPLFPADAPIGRVLAIGVSTGGPNALTRLLPLFPADFDAGIAIVQHMPEGFTEMLAARLNAACGLEVKEAKDGDLLLPGRALIAPGNRHLKIKRLPRGAIAVLSDAPPVSGHRPSADVLFRSVAAEYGRNATAVIMTGMGADGAEGIGDVLKRGGTTIAQDEASSVVFGMPKAALERNHIMRVLSLGDLGPFLVEYFRNKEAEP